MQAKTLVIIPTYDERENVGPISTAVHRHAPEAHILFVDDNSPDGTGALIDQMAAGAPNPFAALVSEDARRLQRKFDDRGKRAASRMLANMGQGSAEVELEAFRPVVVELADPATQTP